MLTQGLTRRCVRPLPWVGALLLLVAWSPASAERLPYAEWQRLADEARSLFGTDGDVRRKLEVGERLLADAEARSWKLLRSAVETEAKLLERQQARRITAWKDTMAIWQRPRARHYKETIRKLLRLFEDLAAADKAVIATEALLERLGRGLGGARRRAWEPLVTAAAGARAYKMSPYARAVAARMAAENGHLKSALASLRRLIQKDPDRRVRLQALEALTVAGPMADELILQRLRDVSWVVRIRAAAILVKRRTKTAVPELIRALRNERPREVEAHGAALRELTGQNFASEAWVWERWWQDNKSRFEPTQDLPIGEERKDPPVVTFYGLPIASDRVLFVIDCSNSMNKRTPAQRRYARGSGTGEKDPRRISVAKRELSQAVKQLPKSARFGIIAFHGAIMTWEPTVVHATAENKKKALAWISDLRATWNTCLGGALRQAFRMAELAPEQAGDTPIDSIVVLSDGIPTYYAYGKGKRQDPEEVLGLVRLWNRQKRIRIHTVAIHKGEVRKFLKRLAEENGGVAVNR